MNYLQLREVKEDLVAVEYSYYILIFFINLNFDYERWLFYLIGILKNMLNLTL